MIKSSLPASFSLGNAWQQTLCGCSCLLMNVFWSLKHYRNVKNIYFNSTFQPVSTCKCLKPFSNYFPLTEDWEMLQISTFKTQNSQMLAWKLKQIVQLSFIFYLLIDEQIVATLKYRLSVRSFIDWVTLTPRDMSACRSPALLDFGTTSALYIHHLTNIDEKNSLNFWFWNNKTFFSTRGNWSVQ